MPLIEYKCDKCGKSHNKMLASKKIKEAAKKEDCPFCKSVLSSNRVFGGAGTNTKMVIDTGNMAKAVETLTDIIEINKRGANDDKNKGTTI